MKSATHQGTCQVCGNLQMLPAGNLSKHGYTVRWNFFEGTCPGADHLPFELDISMIKGAIHSAQENASWNRGYAQTLRNAKKPQSVWVHEYIGAATRNAYLAGDTSIWREIPREQVKFERYLLSWPRYEHSNVTGRGDRDSRQLYDAKSINEAMYKCNLDYAKQCEAKAAQLDQYVAWQQERIKGWKPHPEKLVPVVEKRKGPLTHWAGGYFGVGCAASAYGAQKLWNKTGDISKVTCAKCIKDHAGLKAHYEKLEPKAQAEFSKRYGFQL